MFIEMKIGTHKRPDQLNITVVNGDKQATLTASKERIRHAATEIQAACKRADLQDVALPLIHGNQITFQLSTANMGYIQLPLEEEISRQSTTEQMGYITQTIETVHVQTEPECKISRNDLIVLATQMLELANR